MVESSGNKLFWIWKKAPDVAYQDILNEFDPTRGSRSYCDME
jgi:hypothetical protein